ncbi:OmpP1/FadL family transporter [Flavitalea sp.]|nr:hypothetical protein [Flavitalea sp.]
MKRIAYVFGMFICAQQLNAQVPEDAIRMSWNIPSGTARNQAIGGAMGSLGGEITTLFVNPAGLGMYKKGEFVLSPGISFNKGTGFYRGTEAKSDNVSKFNFGTTGAVLSWADNNSKWKNKTFGIGVNRMANFNNTQYYKGQNNYSSFSESFAEEFAASGLDISTTLYDAPLSLGTKLANYTYLIDTATIAGQTEVVGLPLRDATIGNKPVLFDQEKTTTTKGGITELALGFASNMDDKIYIGAGLGIPIMNYSRTSVLRETDATGVNNNNFGYAEYLEEYEARGVGINAKLGVIFKPATQLRIGIAIHTPSWYAIDEQITGRIETDLENYFPAGKNIRVATADSIYTQFGYGIPEFSYDLVSPWKFLVSGSYVLYEVEDVTQQKGFITADIEYVTHGSSKFRSSDEEQNDDYYDAVNSTIKNEYKGAFNFRVGGELKFNTIMTRLGFAYYGNPYEEKSYKYGENNENTLKPRRMNLSGGLGYRNRGIFIDLTYIHSLNRDVNFPYRLADKDNTFAALKESNGTVLLTVGFKFP